MSNIIRQIIHKQLRCPVCGFKRLIDADADNVSELVPEGSMIVCIVHSSFQRYR